MASNIKQEEDECLIRNNYEKRGSTKGSWNPRPLIPLSYVSRWAQLFKKQLEEWDKAHPTSSK